MAGFVLVSGATSDIGREICRTLVREGYSLLLHGRDRARLEELRGELGGECELWCADLREVSSLKDSLKHVLAERGIAVYGFVHCAGVLKILPFKTFREEYAREIFDVNFFSAAAIVQALLAKGNAAALRRVVFISAMFGKRGDRGNTFYAASKGALDALVKSLALELAPGVNVNSILPGAVATRMAERVLENPELAAALQKKYPIGYGRPADVAAMVGFLLGEGGRWITAQNIFVDGGASMF